MHVSKPPENPYIKQIFKEFSDVSKEMGVSVGIKHKKINVSNPRVAWEHEQFSRFRVTALTLSEMSTPPDFLESTGGLHDTRESTDAESVIRAARLVSESLARRIYGLKGRNIDVFAENSSLAINPHYIRSWLDLLSRTPRVAPFLQKNDPFIAALEKVLDGCFEWFHLSHSLTWFLVFWQDMTLVSWCRNCLHTLLMCVFKVMRLMACSLSMMRRKQL
ncbi:hypothetical protein ZEAMMB73_Zm00001d034970 [Zea mays]|uniref:Uncharacterized protein n=1 Tax=Zea mays TaxID=4577 RepID=A0A1D6LDC0_MAIZE|nr:hypothetical protein ZEAMMB73_Zm00001d034970 [Zea mays]